MDYLVRTFDSRHYNAIIGDNSSGSTDRAGIMADTQIRAVSSPIFVSSNVLNLDFVFMNTSTS